ncbi:hypothetical protein [Variovorax ginsengisoli]|uniref:Alkylhydroperoxidase family enzyme n=1 Tax=Variovorax ginsengisoli TaxID=363844 RepID=A0ABT9S8U5_9BURK|nr:hypothetical protein [Variovorax ginsengisoli]MDP9900774.1 alkylhydroperoxidase family enzyme [Variovorax ginsengisoli]
MRFSAELTLRPDSLSPEHVQALKAVGLTDIEVLDLAHFVELFAWAYYLGSISVKRSSPHPPLRKGPSMRLPGGR